MRRIKSFVPPILAGQFEGRLSSDPFLRHNIIFFTGSLTIAVANYLYYPVLGRLMRLEDFGEVQVLVSLVLQAAILLSAFSTVTMNVASSNQAEETKRRIFLELEKLAFFIMLGGFVIMLVFIHDVQAFLHFTSVYPFIALMVAMLISTPVTFHTAYLQGRHNFAATSIGGIIGAVLKLVFSVGLVVAGWGALGAIGGIVAAQFVALLYVAYRTRRYGLGGVFPDIRTGIPNLRLIKPELAYGLLVLAVSLATTLLYSGDIIVVKHFFSATDAGLYAGVASIARIIFFLTASIAGVLFPLIQLDKSPGENWHLLMRSGWLMGLLGGGALLVFTLFPKLIVHLLIGDRYLPLAPLLPLLGLAIFLISAINLSFYYFLALRRFFVAVVALVGVAATLGLMVYSHATLAAVVANLIYGSILILVMLGAWVIYLNYVRLQQRGAIS